ncbi:ABC transporter permease [Streptomyces sp. NBC_01190]|uniref:ABC transporter permease n=1 Tax=Streptomyces sp. NBC_01190 TaxID=2903767 RepID=UPI0038674B06|nr:ABC transporter permease [Streptomyces sp. NBC_01190]
MVDALRGSLNMVRVAAWTQAKASRGSAAPLVNGVVQPIVLTVITIASTPAGNRPGPGLAIGIALLSIWGGTLWTTGAILQHELWGGTLAANLTGVYSPWAVLVGKATGATLINGVAVTASTGVTSYALGSPVTVDHPWWFAAGVLATLASGVTLGLLLACILLVTRHADSVASALTYVIFLLCGAVVPLGYLPVVLRWPSAVMSLRWAKEFLSAAAAGRPAAGDLGALLALTAAYAVCAVVFLNRLVDRERRRGTLEIA